MSIRIEVIILSEPEKKAEELSSEKKLLYKTKMGGKIAYITINNPKKMNAIDLDMCKQLLNFLDEAEKDSKVKCVVIKSVGERIFSAGWDLGMFKNFKAETLDDLLTYGADISRTIYFLKKPVIMQIQAPVIGLGTIMSWAADFRFVADKPDLYFYLPELELGIFPATGPTFGAVNLLGIQRARDMLLGLKKMKIKDIEDVITVVPAEELDKEVKKFARQLTNVSANLLYTTKTALNIMGKRFARKCYDLENDMARYFFKNAGIENPEDQNDFLQKMWEKYGN